MLRSFGVHGIDLTRYKYKKGTCFMVLFSWFGSMKLWKSSNIWMG